MWLLDAALSNPIPVIMGFIAIAATFYIYHKNKTKKSFCYEILTNEPILTSTEELSGKIKLYYEESPDEKIQIKDGSLIILNFINNGNVPIESEDFYRGPTISFDSKVDILSAEVIKTNPEGLKPELIVSNHEVALRPLLLNQKDSLSIKMLLTGLRKHTAININARIVGIPEVTAIKRKKNFRNRLDFIFSSNFIERLILHPYFMIYIIIISILFFSVLSSLVSSSIRISPDLITTKAGLDTEIDIFVPDEAIISHIMNNYGIFKASFPVNYDGQPNITFAITPNSFLSAPAAAKITMHIGTNTKPGIYAITVEAIQGFDKRTAVAYVNVAADNKTK